MTDNFSPQNLEPRPMRRILTTLIRVAPMNLEVSAAILFLVSIILYPSALILNLIFAVLAGYIVYGAVKRAEVYTMLKDASLSDEMSGSVQHFFVKPPTVEVVRGIFRSGINIIFGVAVLINAGSILALLAVNPLPVATLVSYLIVLVVYILFMIANGYTRAQMIQAYGRAPRLFG